MDHYPDVAPEALIALVRLGVVLDPLGRTADELEQEYRDYEAERDADFWALTDEQVEDLASRNAPIPRREKIETPFEERDRLDREFAGRMRALQTQRDRVEAAERELMAQHVDRVARAGGDPSMQVRELAAIAGVELRQSTPSVERRMSDAWGTLASVPVAHEAAKSGRITTGHLRVIERETAPLRETAEVTPDECAAIETELVALAERLTPGQLRLRARRLVDAALATPLQTRHDLAREQRRVDVVDVGDGMADLIARMPVLEAHAIMDRLTQAAKAKPEEDPRTYDQFRADALTELLLCGLPPEDAHSTKRFIAHVQVTIPATELLRDPDLSATEGDGAHLPALLDGRSLVDADTARWLAHDERVWERLFTDPVTGVAVATDTYSPRADQRRWLRARDQRCRAPGCAKPARRGDIDHTSDHAGGGPTAIDNLACLCRYDHVLKHNTRFTVRQLPGGVLEWTSPIGQVITNEPPPAGPTFREVQDSIWAPPPRELTQAAAGTPF